MAVKQTGRKTYKTMQGKAVDMDLLRKRNELEIAVGNAKVNARGDELGAGGKIVKKREDVLADYYRDNPSKVPVVEKGQLKMLKHLLNQKQKSPKKTGLKMLKVIL